MHSYSSLIPSIDLPACLFDNGSLRALLTRVMFLSLLVESYHAVQLVAWAASLLEMPTIQLKLAMIVADLHG